MNRRWLLVCCLSLSFGCGAALTEGPGSITALRAEAAGAPTDPVLQQRLALAEMFSYEGDPASVDGQLQRALAVDPKSPRLWLALGLHADSHGRPSLALDAYLHALALCPRSTDPIAPQLAELAVHAVGGLDGSVTDYRNKVLPALQALLADRDLALPARYGVAGLLAQLAYRRGDRPAAQGFAENVGCITHFRGAGPFGPRELLSFDQRHAAAPGKPLAASYDLGPGRGVSPTRELGARGCSVSLGGGPIARGGTSYAQAFVELQRRGAYSLRFESPNAAEVFLDGRSILRVDRRRELAPDVLYVPLDLDGGRHEFTVKLTTRHPNPAIAFALAPRRAQDEAAFALPFTPDAQEGFAVYARAAIAGVRGDVLSARQILDKIDVSAKPSALLLMLRAGLLLSDPLMPNDSREDDARRLLSAALERDPGVWHPRVQLADMAAGHGRPKEAIADLREQMNRFPEVPTIGLTLAQLLRAQQWDAEADAVIAKMRKLVPDGCAPLSAELEALRNRNREQKAAEVAEALERCEGQANARYALLLRQRHWDAAQKELERLAALEPPQNRYPWLLARMELAKNRGDDAAIERQITELRALYPRATTGTLEEIDRLGARGDTAGALSVLQQALDREPASMAELNRLVPVLGGKHVLDAYRIDGEAAIKRFEASGRSYDAPQVLVFDYMAVAVLQDGSSVELVHTIEKAQSDEAVNQLAEVRVPEGAHVLKLQTIKPDGRRLEADAIEGKEEISLPTVTPGDYVELEYIDYKDPSEAFPGGYAGERFYFKSFEIPFDHSQMVVIAPKTMALSVDPRGPAPKVEELISGNLRVWNFQVDQSIPLKPEPNAVSAREFLPSVRIGARADWSTFVDSLRDALADRNINDPEISALVQQIVGDADPGDYTQRAKRLYAWVLEHVENNDDLFSQAAVMLRARTGNRARVLHYMLGLAGVPAKLALVRSASGDTVPSEMADGDTYEHLFVTYGDGPKAQWLYTVERYAPFGYVPPLLRGQPALLLTAGAEHTLSPAPQAGQDERRLELDIAVAQDGGARVSVVETLHGTGAVAWRAQLESVPAAELNRRFGEEYVARLLPGAHLTSLKITGREQDAETLSLQYAFDLGALGRRVGESWALPPMLASRLAQNYAQAAQRTTDELVPAPLEIEIVMRFHFPKGASLPAAPEPVALQAAIPSRPRFDQKSRLENGALVIERTLRLPAMRIGVKDYGAFSAFCRMVDVAEGKELLVKLR